MVSANNIFIAGANTGRLYIYNGGWSEQQPVGAVDKAWFATGVSSDGTKAIAVVNGGRVYVKH